MDEFEATLFGDTFLVKVLDYSKLIPAYTSGLPEDCYPAEGGEFEFELYDMEGYRAAHIEAKMSDDDVESLRTSYEEVLNERRYD